MTQPFARLCVWGADRHTRMGTAVLTGAEPRPCPRACACAWLLLMSVAMDATALSCRHVHPLMPCVRVSLCLRGCACAWARVLSTPQPLSVARQLPVLGLQPL